MVQTRLIAKPLRVVISILALLGTSLACNLSNDVPPTPTLEPTPFPATITPTSGPTDVIGPTPSPIVATSTPVDTPTVSPMPTVGLSAQVCATCEGLRVRDQPGTAGKLIVTLPSKTAITVIARVPDGSWYEVITPDGQKGWGVAKFITLNGDPNQLTVVPIAVADLPTLTISPTLPAAPDNGPILTGVTSTSRQIFLSGQQKGNLASVFTRVGDSITAAPQFLNPLLGPHDLGQYAYLSAALSYFSGPNARGANPFQAASIAARPYWTTADVLNPDLSPSSICLAGETPVACEYRNVKPAVALILIGTNDAAQNFTPDQYQNNLQSIVQISIDMGVIPVLSTLPPKHLDDWNNGRVDQFNGIVVAVARYNDIPLWNLWLALQNTPNQGISADGVHLNFPPDGQNATFDAGHLAYGYPVRNLTALQVLDTLRRQVLYGGGTPIGGAPPVQIIGTVPRSQSASGCANAPLPRLVVGGSGLVTPGLPNKLRAGPHKSDTVIGSMPAGAIFSVIGGPICGDGLRWWQVTYKGLNGWTADGQGTEYWLLPAN
jgi:hypothetical protein